MTIDAYKTLYDSSVTFGVRKQLQAENGMSDMESRVTALRESKKGTCSLFWLTLNIYIQVNLNLTYINFFMDSFFFLLFFT